MSRKSCKECTLKHIGQAIVLSIEVEQGYKEHKHLAIGHLAEAEAEIFSVSEDTSNIIREIRKKYFTDNELDVKRLLSLTKIIEAYETECEVC